MTVTKLDIDSRWTPRQREATIQADKHRYVLFGGARGPGKSYWVRWWLLRYLILAHQVKGLSHVRVMLACEDYPALQDRHINRIRAEFPDTIGSYNERTHEFRLCEALGSGVLCLRNLDDPSKYQSAEFAAIGVDELTKNQMEMFNILRGSLRWPGINQTRFIAATNPGGVGHLWVKQLWIDRQFPDELAPLRDEFVFVRALPSDNPHLSDSYWQELKTLPDALRRAWVEGDWNVFQGQAFPEWNESLHVCSPFEVPASWPRWRAVDWGYSQPFCCLWFAWDKDQDIVYVYRELYQREMTDQEQAQRIIYMTALDEDILYTLADPSMWTRKTHEGLTFSSADEYARIGIFLQPADNNRLNGVRRVREALRVRQNGKPGVIIFSTCRNLIRTLPSLVYDAVNVEDIDTEGEDHAYDALRYGLMRIKPIYAPSPPQVDVYAFLE